MAQICLAFGIGMFSLFCVTVKARNYKRGGDRNNPSNWNQKNNPQRKKTGNLQFLALIRPWYGPDTALIRPWYGPDTALIRPCYGPDTALIRPFFGQKMWNLSNCVEQNLSFKKKEPKYKDLICIFLLNTLIWWICEAKTNQCKIWCKTSALNF